MTATPSTRGLVTEVVTVQRQASADPATTPATPEPEPGASSTALAGEGAPEPGSDERSPKDMVDELWPHIERRLRMNLLLERERKGALSGALWSTGGR